jgi:hypothetical protein
LRVAQRRAGLMRTVAPRPGEASRRFAQGVRQGKEGNGGHDHEGSSAGINNVLNLFSSSLSMIHLVLCLNDTSVLGTWVGSVPRLED